ncbi:probable L-cysteine desulfhydrase, chloroplastic [Impatiens glandulifera]|uniref:probable L-cysteine desulfhydrase, chloroplastic n=1 Tax=Impatiens glandulifera TaxID=253017 RepID=UPI001FB19AD9|nr:probable L-cysteine desulfhydrase, chloroplastic [Impatiens glandulifera]
MGSHHQNKFDLNGSDESANKKLITDAEICFEFSHHRQDVARINNGSFGSCPASVIAAQKKWQRQYLQHPDNFYFKQLKPSILRSRQAIKELINAEYVDEVSIVDNATTAAAIVLQQTSRAFIKGMYSKGDAVVMLHYAYGSVKKSVQAYVTDVGGRVIEVHLPFPVSSNDEIINEFRKALEEGRSNGLNKVRLAVIDHITSMPCVVIPVKELVQICREEGVDQIFVDAAHAIGCVNVDMKEIGADFYTSNLYKWFFCPPAAALLYSRRKSDWDLHHPVVSHEYGNGLANESAWIGTRDYSPQLVIPDVIEFVNRFEGGIEGIRKRNHTKVFEMAEILTNAWGTNLGAPPEMCASMAMVGLPACLEIKSDSDCFKLRAHLRTHFGVEVPIYYQVPPLTKDDNEEDNSIITGYARISYQVYNIVEDYYKFRDVINKLVKDGITCEQLL